jgi:hypothetical protein
MVSKNTVLLRNKSPSDFHLFDIEGRAYVFKPGTVLNLDEKQGRKLAKDFAQRLEILEAPSINAEVPKPKKTTKEEK